MKHLFGICGPFDFEERETGGQTVKTREFYYALLNRVGKNNITLLESTDYRKKPLLFLIRYIRLLRQSEHTILFPAQNGIKVFSYLYMFKGKNRLHYCVVGGWLPKMIKEDRGLKKRLSKFDSIHVETNVMCQSLKCLGLNNVSRLLNFKNINPVSNTSKTGTPVRLCFFSRIVEGKGIEDAIEVVARAIHMGKSCIFDIYGPIVDGYDIRFKQLMTSFPNEIRYLGQVHPQRSIDVLQNYDLQLFPTRYYTEGIPGSIIDSYYAGVPVLSSMWESFSDVVEENKTGIGYNMRDIDDFYKKLVFLLDNPQIIDRMKANCLAETKKYLPSTIIDEFLEQVGVSIREEHELK